MEQFIIDGPTKLKGRVCVSGSKNSALPIIASCLLIPDTVILKNVPNIKDIKNLLEIMSDLGANYSFIDQNTLTINCSKIKKKNPNAQKIKKLRASVLLLAPLLARNQRIQIAHPGGCLIGTRPIDIHLKALQKMGAIVNYDNELYTIKAESLKPAKVCLDFSVTATENIIMASVLTLGTTQIRLAAAEPHVQELCNFLNLCGAKIKGAGTHYLEIEGVKNLHGVEYNIGPDQIESGTFAIAAAASGGDVIIEGFISEQHDALLSKFERANVNFKILNGDRLHILPSKKLQGFSIRTEVYPGFPTDLQAPMSVLATQCSGTTHIHETIFEGRLGYISELIKMGAAAHAHDLHHASIFGPNTLHGTRITSLDLRAGATLVIAAIIAHGQSRIDQIELIDRGYEKIDQKFKALGAKIKRIQLKEFEV